MKKFVVLSLVASAALGLSACGGTVANNSTDLVVNTDDGNMTVVDDNMSAPTNVVDANASNAAM